MARHPDMDLSPRGADTGTLGVVLLAMGGPATLDEVEPFLRELFADGDLIRLPWGSFGQRTLARLLARRRARTAREFYRAIGGGSPLVAISRRQAQALETALRRAGLEARCAIAMRYGRPSAREAVQELAARGARSLLALSSYPQFSRATTGSSLAALDLALREEGAGPPSQTIDRYGDDGGYLAALAETVREAMATLPEPVAREAPVIFSAHGLPKSYVDRGDPYERETRATVEGVARLLGLGNRAHLGFQSRVGPLRWLGPSTEEVIRKLGAAGSRALVLVPVSFVADNVETLHEIDIGYREAARRAGIADFVRAPTLNDRPSFITALADLVLRRTGHRAQAAAAEDAACSPHSEGEP